MPSAVNQKKSAVHQEKDHQQNISKTSSPSSKGIQVEIQPELAKVKEDGGFRVYMRYGWGVRFMKKKVEIKSTIAKSK